MFHFLLKLPQWSLLTIPIYGCLNRLLLSKLCKSKLNPGVLGWLRSPWELRELISSFDLVASWLSNDVSSLSSKMTVGSEHETEVLCLEKRP
jgi:hypothetical protein